MLELSSPTIMISPSIPTMSPHKTSCVFFFLCVFFWGTETSAGRLLRHNLVHQTSEAVFTLGPTTWPASWQPATFVFGLVGCPGGHRGLPSLAGVKRHIAAVLTVEVSKRNIWDFCIWKRQTFIWLKLWQHVSKHVFSKINLCREFGTYPRVYSTSPRCLIYEPTKGIRIVNWIFVGWTWCLCCSCSHLAWIPSNAR